MEKFKVGDKVYIRRNAARSRNDILGRNKPGARVSVELRTRPIVGKVLQYGGRPIVEYSPTTRTRFTGTLIKQNGYKWDIKSDSGEIYKDVSEADFDLIDSSNAVRSTNAVVAKALNAVTDKSWDGKQLSVGDWVRQKDSGLFGRIVGKYNNYLWNVKWRNGNDTFVEGAAPSDLVFMRHDTTSVNFV